MALALKNLFGSGTALLERERIDTAIEKLNVEKVEIDSAATLADRKVKAAERKQCVLGDDNSGKRLAAKIKEIEDSLAAARRELNHWNGTRLAAGIVQGEKHKALTRDLIRTAPPEIDAAIAPLDLQISDAKSARKSTNRFDDRTQSVEYFSNNKSTDAFIVAATAAKEALSNLKLEALDLPELKRAIAKILKPLPKLDFTLKLVDSAAVKS